MQRKSIVAILAAMVFVVSGAAAADEPKAAAQPDLAATRRVVAAVVEAAKANAAAARPLKGDALTECYVRAAAAAAAKLPAEQGPSAFLTALGVALDDSSLVRDNRLLAGFYRQVESDEERKLRLAVLGSPAVRGRRDWCQHFAVSAMLTALAGPTAAEAAGLLKERLDMRPGGSGFSFADLSADYAGVAFAARVQKGGLALDKLATGFAVNDHVPDAAGLTDGLTAEEFRKQIGSFDDDRFAAEVARIRQRIAELPGQKEK
jgi:uncharacterized protein YfiM (DUF2279 family)